MQEQGLTRPSAPVVIGGALVALYGFSTLGTVINFFQIEAIRASLEVLGSGLSAEAYLGLSVAMGLAVTIAGAGLLTGARWGRGATTGALTATLIFGYLVAPNFYSLLGYLPLLAALIWRLHIVDDSEIPESEANLVLVAISAVLLLYAGVFLGFGVGAALVSPFLTPAPIGLGGASADAMALGVAVGSVGAALVFWALGAALFKFRWSYATLGWTFLGASVTCLYATAYLAWIRAFPEISDPVLAELARTFSSVPTPVVLAVGAAFAPIGVWCVMRQKRLERGQRRVSRERVEDVFR